MTSAATQCQVCGSPLDDVVDGQCPGCLIDMVLTEAVEPETPRNGPRVLGDYELIRVVGAGGMGIVYEARHIATGDKVALKLIRNFQFTAATTLRRFQIEAEAISRLAHPDIVRVHEVGECDEQPFLVMDFVEGGNLAAAFAKNKWTREQQREIARLMVRISRAVHHAHERGVIHRDLKPGNILIDRDGNPRLTDFGLAKVLQPQDASEPISVTGSGEAPGTPSYMAPEQVSAGITNAASDIYSLGAVLYSLLAGHPPFRGATPLETFQQIVEQPPVPPRSVNPLVSRDLETICLKCLEKNPRGRYSTAEVLAEDLDRFAEGRPVRAQRAGVLLRARRWIAQNRLGTALIASLCIGLVTSLTLLALVTEQRREIELDRNQAFDDSMQRVSLIWRDPATRSVTISARELAILAGAKPMDARDAERRVLFGVVANDGPSSMAQRYARLLTTLQREVQRKAGAKVAFDLQLFKRFSSGGEMLERDEADIMVVTATDLLRASKAAGVPSLIGWSEASREGVIFSRVDAAATLADLRGRSVAFGDESQPTTITAKARLFAAGLQSAYLARIRHVADFSGELDKDSNARIVESVLRGEFDAGVIPRNVFERHKHRGLFLLDRFTEPPQVLAARSGLDPDLAGTLKQVLRSQEFRQHWPESKFTSSHEEPRWFREFSQDMQKAAHFEAESR